MNKLINQLTKTEGKKRNIDRRKVKRKIDRQRQEDKINEEESMKERNE